MAITYVPPKNNKAKNIKLDDVDNNFQSNDVEGALKELAENGGSGSNIDDSSTATNKTWSANKIDSQFKDIAKSTSVENGKLYLLKADGSKIDTGTTLPTSGSGATTNIIDNLESNSTTDALSAKQGKVLNDKILEYSGGKKQVYLTQIEYNSLTDEDKNDETKVYNITDEEDTGGITIEQSMQLSLAYEHSQSNHAPSNAQKNSDITKAEIETKLIGEIDTHTHPSSGKWDRILISPNGNKFTLSISDEGVLHSEQILEYGDILISNTSLIVNENKSITFTVKLNKQPTNVQVINLALNNGNCTLDKTTLTFDRTNYNIEQIVTVSGVADSSSLVNKSSIITLSSDKVDSVTIDVTIVNTDLETTFSTYNGYPLSITVDNCDSGVKSYISEIKGNSTEVDSMLTGVGVNNGDNTFNINLDITTGSESLTKIINIPIRLYKLEGVSDKLCWNGETGKYFVEQNIKVSTSTLGQIFDEGDYYLAYLASDGYPGEGMDTIPYQKHWTNLPTNIYVNYRFDGSVFIKAYKTDYPTSDSVKQVLDKGFILYYVIPSNIIETTLTSIIDFNTNSSMSITCSDAILPSSISAEVPVKG